MRAKARLTRIAASGLLAATLGSAGDPAAAAWLRDEWRNFRTFPRLTEANRLLLNKKYDEARRYVDEAERIDPNSVETTLLKFSICEQQPDLACIRDLAARWQARNPESGLGPAMQAYLAYTQGQTADVARLSQQALQMRDLPADSRSALGRGWVSSLLSEGQVDQAEAAVSWLDSHKVAVTPQSRSSWEQAIAAARAPSPPQRGGPGPGPAHAQAPVPAPAPGQAPAIAQAPAAPKPPAAARPAAPPKRAAVASAEPAPRRKAAAPPAALPPPPPAPPPPPSAEYEVLTLIQQSRYPEAVARLQALEREGRMDAQTREGLILNLQPHDCPGVLQLVPASPTAPLTTARQQLAAGYCSQNDNELALRHFKAARALAGDTMPAIAAQALAGQAHAQVVLGDEDGARAALAEAVRLAPGEAQIHADYGYRLKAAGDRAQASEQFETAFRLDGERVELLPELAELARLQNQSDKAVQWAREAIDQQPKVAQRQGLDADEAQRRLFAWRRAVQVEEDRFGWYANANVRLDHGPDGARATSPVDYAQYGGTLNVGASYRFNPIDAQLPTWGFVRGSQGLDDRSLSLTPDTQLAGAGVRQRLSRDYLVVASAEYLWRKGAPYEDDAMLRLSASNTWGGDWNPVDRSWLYANLYGDLAWLVRQRSYYATIQADLGRAYALPDVSFRGALMPYLTSGYSASNDGIGRVDVTRLDVGLGIALISWHWEDKYRAPAINQRLALEYRTVIGGNAKDRNTVQLKWIIQH